MRDAVPPEFNSAFWVYRLIILFSYGASVQVDEIICSYSIISVVCSIHTEPNMILWTWARPLSSNITPGFLIRLLRFIIHFWEEIKSFSILLQIINVIPSDSHGPKFGNDTGVWESSWIVWRSHQLKPKRPSADESPASLQVPEYGNKFSFRCVLCFYVTCSDYHKSLLLLSAASIFVFFHRLPSL